MKSSSDRSRGGGGSRKQAAAKNSQAKVSAKARAKVRAGKLHEKPQTRITSMSDMTTNKPKTKPANFASTTETPKFEIHRFDMPKFEVPKMEVPAAFRELAEKSVIQAKDNWEKMKAAT